MGLHILKQFMSQKSILQEWRSTIKQNHVSITYLLYNFKKFGIPCQKSPIIFYEQLVHWTSFVQ